MASHSRFHKSVAKAMFSTRVEQQESSEFLREFKKKKKKLEKSHWSGCGIKPSGSSRTSFLSLERIPNLLCITPSRETQ